MLITCSYVKKELLHIVWKLWHNLQKGFLVCMRNVFDVPLAQTMKIEKCGRLWQPSLSVPLSFSPQVFFSFPRPHLIWWWWKATTVFSLFVSMATWPYLPTFNHSSQPLLLDPHGKVLRAGCCLILPVYIGMLVCVCVSQTHLICGVCLLWCVAIYIVQDNLLL